MKFPSVMREKERYILFYLITENNKKFSQKEILNAILHSTISLLGEVKIADASLYLIEWNESINFGILKTTNKFKDEIIFAISIISKINDCPVSFNPIKTFGTIKRAKKFINKKIYQINQFNK